VNRLRDRLPYRADDRGVSLVELLVYSVLLVVVLALVGSMTYRTLVSQRDVRAVTEANNRAQLVAASVEAGVRSAAALKHTPLSGGDELLIARTQTGAVDAATWSCQEWYYDASTQTLYAKRVAESDATAPAIEEPTTVGDYSTWMVLSEGLTGPTPEAKIFAPSATTLPTTIHLGVQVAAGTREPVEISTLFTRRPQGATQEGVGTPCFS